MFGISSSRWVRATEQGALCSRAAVLTPGSGTYSALFDVFFAGGVVVDFVAVFG